MWRLASLRNNLSCLSLVKGGTRGNGWWKRMKEGVQRNHLVNKGAWRQRVKGEGGGASLGKAQWAKGGALEVNSTIHACDGDFGRPIAVKHHLLGLLHLLNMWCRLNTKHVPGEQRRFCRWKVGGKRQWGEEEKWKVRNYMKRNLQSGTRLTNYKTLGSRHKLSAHPQRDGSFAFPFTVQALVERIKWPCNQGGEAMSVVHRPGKVSFKWSRRAPV